MVSVTVEWCLSNVEYSHNRVPTSLHSALMGVFACLQSYLTANASDIMHFALLQCKMTGCLVMLPNRLVQSVTYNVLHQYLFMHRCQHDAALQETSL